jgi:hypothetical protein
VIREDRFLISRRPYAIDLSSLKGEQREREDRILFSGSVKASWFRRQGGVTRACVGSLGLWSHYLTERLNLSKPREVLSVDLDGRYGGDCHGRWDGENYWGAQKPDTIERHLALLRPMLANYPDLPQGFDGWWRFE